MAITNISVSCPRSKLKLRQDSWFYSHPGHCSLGGISKWPHLASPWGICLLLIPNNYIPRSFTEITLWPNMHSLLRRQTDGGRTWPCGGTNICPQLHQLELPCHSQAELVSISSLKVWGDTQKPCCDIAYLLVWVEDIIQSRQYGISLVWVHPNQVRAATIEEAVEI